MRILSCNIRFSGADDGPDNWEFRKEYCAGLILSLDADVICFQELVEEQFSYMRSRLQDYSHYGLCDEPGGRRPLNSVFFRKAKYNLLNAAGYWLSETPHIPGSKSWESTCVRFTSWVCLEDTKTKAVFRVLNTHLDHFMGKARKNQARIVNEDALAWPPDYPQILTGDMNADAMNFADIPVADAGIEQEGPIWTFKQGGWRDSYEAVHGADYPGFSYHSFKGPDFKSSCGRIDWIFFRGGLLPKASRFIDDSKDGRFPSDHYFLCADFEMA